MPTYNWPPRGFKPWDTEIKAIVDSINAEVDGRLGPTQLTQTINGIAPAWSSLPVNASDPRFGGLVNDGSVATPTSGTDNYPTIRAAAIYAATHGKSLFIPAGVYRCEGIIPWIGELYGAGRSATILVNNTTVGVASYNWITGLGGSISFRDSLHDLQLVGPGGTVDNAIHGIVQRSYYSHIYNVTVRNFNGNGIHFTSRNQAGTASGSTYVNNRVEKFDLLNNAGYGFYGGESDANFTDAHISDFIISTPGTSLSAVRIEQAAGWKVDRYHTYGGQTSWAILIRNCWNTQIGDGYIESWGVGAAGLRLDVLDSVHVGSITAIGSSEVNGTVVNVQRQVSSSVPRPTVIIDSIHLRHNNDVQHYLVENTSSVVDVDVTAYRATGNFSSRVALQSGTNVVRSPQGIRRSGGRALIDRGDAVELASAGTGYVTWSGNTAKSLVIPLPPIAGFGKKTVFISVISRANHNGASRTIWVGFAHISAKTNGTDPWVVFQRDLIAPTGFAANPVITVANTTGNLGEMTVSFTATDSDAFGDVTAFVS